MARSSRTLPVARIVTASILALSVHGCAHSGEKKAEQQARAIAEKVRQRAKLSEKAEGRHGLIKDKVSVRTDRGRQPIVEQFGEASFYGEGLQGKKTARGEPFDPNELTAAHPTLPLGTQATVTNLYTGKSVEVEINDRGPYAKGRDIDLSKAAAKKLGMIKDGAAPVKIEAEVRTEGDTKD